MLMKMCTKSLFLKGLDIDEDVRHITNFKTNWKRNGRELKKNGVIYMINVLVNERKTWF